MTDLGKMNGGRWVGLETRREAVGCRCPSGHRFSAELLTAVSLLTDRVLLAELVDKGVQERECPACHAVCRLAEPVGLHDPEARRFALYVPESLSHRRIALLALTLEHIATLDPTATPEYFETPVLLCGRAELRRWLEGSSGPRTVGFGSQPERLASKRTDLGPGHSDAAIRKEAVATPGSPEIHAAFADLIQDGPNPAGPHETQDFVSDLEESSRDSDDDWLSDALLEDRFEVDSRIDSPAPRSGRRVIEEELGDNAEFVSQPEEETEQEVHTSAVVNSPGPTGIEDSSISLNQGRVHMSYRVDGTTLAKFATSRVDLWFQLFEIDSFPLVTLTLVDDNRAASPESLTWLLDLTRPEQRAIATTLQRRYQARVQLYISSRYEPLVLELGGHRESNVSVVLDRAATVLADHPPDDRPFDRAAERFARLKAPHGNVAVPLEFHDFRQARTFADAAHFARLVAEWFEDERYNYLIFVRSFPLDTFEELVRRSLEQAMAFGVCVPEPLLARALTVGLAGSRKELTARLVERFSTLVHEDPNISDEMAVDNWSDLLRRANADKVPVSPETIHTIQQQVARAGRSNDPRIQEALSKIKASP